MKFFATILFLFSRWWIFFGNPFRLQVFTISAPWELHRPSNFNVTFIIHQTCFEVNLFCFASLYLCMHFMFVLDYTWLVSKQTTGKHNNFKALCTEADLWALSTLNLQLFLVSLILHYLWELPYAMHSMQIFYWQYRVPNMFYKAIK